MTTQLIEARKKKLIRRFRSFTGVAHRLEQVRIKNEVIYINDSKAENVNATYFALESIRKPIIWITGGDDSETDYWELMKLVREKVEAIIMIGNNNERIYHLFAPVISKMYEVNSMKEAVKLSNKISESGMTVLLSPACKPDLQYADYEERGNQFKQAVLKNI